MPKTPKGHKRPADVISNAVRIMRIATGEIHEDALGANAEGKDQAAVLLGRKGGQARAAALSKAKRKKIARVAAVTRWAKRKKQ